MINPNILPDVAVLANELDTATIQYPALNQYAKLVSQCSLSILKGQMTDNYDQMYYKLVLPMFKLIPEDERKIKTKINKIKNLLMPESVRAKKANDALQYEIYKKRSGNRF